MITRALPQGSQNTPIKHEFHSSCDLFPYILFHILIIKALPQGSQNTAIKHEFHSNCALFVGNKWDVIQEQHADTVKKDVIEKLKNCWPGLVPDDQVIFMSIKGATRAKEYGVASDDFVTLMKRAKSMILKSAGTRLEIHRR